MILGTDFDNTVVDYEHVFPLVARDLGVEVPTGMEKKSLRDFVRTLSGGEVLWQKIQAAVYGDQMCEARLINGFSALVRSCQEKGIPLYIVSHKTRYAVQKPTEDLRAYALEWMENRGFFSKDRLGLSPDDVFFEDTREKKVDRIRSLGCTHFVDDMQEVLLDENFPPYAEGIWFTRSEDVGIKLKRAASWGEIDRLLFD